MPLGNLTSQFFANIYLNELDYFVKHKLKAKFYIRYVDDFVILHKDKKILEEYKYKINEFLNNELLLQLHPSKSKIIKLKEGVSFLGMKIFYYHKLLKKKNIKKMQRQLEDFKSDYNLKKVDYDEIYEYFQGWFTYAKNANTHKLRKKLGKKIENYFPNEISYIEINGHLK